MILSYKYRIYLNKEQRKVLEQNFRFCSFLYNCALEERNSYYKKYKKSISYASQTAQLPEIKKSFKEQSQNIYSQSLQQVLKRLDASYKNFFRRVGQKASKAGFPRYKSADRYRSIVFPQSDLKKGGVKLLDNKKLNIFGIPGEVRVKWHRPYQGRCKQITLLKQGEHFYIVLSCDGVPKALLPKTGKEIGIDLGLNSFIMADDGTKFHHPKPYKTAKEKLAWHNRRLAAKQRGSNNRKRAKRSLAKCYERVSNVRNDFLHKVAKQLVAENDRIIIEDLNVKSMLEAKGFVAKKSNIQDASWARFASLLAYKAERAGKLLIRVNPKNTSKKCFCCSNIKADLTLEDRTYNCEACGFAIDRDLNAALNIKWLGTSLMIG